MRSGVIAKNAENPTVRAMTALEKGGAVNRAQSFCSRWASVSLLGLSAGYWIYMHVRLQDYLLDDTYIHFRVAENMALFGIPHFNLGEAVKVSSSLPWTLVLASLFTIWPDSISAVMAASALVSYTGLVSFVGLIQTLAGRTLDNLERVGLGLVYLATVQVASLAAMETPLALLFSTLGLQAYVRGRPWAFALLALACVTRPELAALTLLLAVAALMSRRPPWLASLCWGILAAGPFLAFDLLHFGTVVPHAVVAKPLVHHYALRESITALQPEIVLRLTQWSTGACFLLALAYLLLGTLPALSLARSWASLRSSRIQVVVASAIGGLAVIIAYVSARTLVFAWYRPLYFLLLFIPPLALATRERSRVVYAAALLAAMPGLVDLAGNIAASGGQVQSHSFFLEGARSRQTLRVARQLARDYPDAILMTPEIGAAGFGFPGHIDDGAGIATPRALRYHPLPVPEERGSQSEGALPRDFVRDEDPDIVLGVDRLLAGVLRDPLRAGYVHIRYPSYTTEDDARRDPGQLLWGTCHELDVLIREDLWKRAPHRPTTH